MAGKSSLLVAAAGSLAIALLHLAIWMSGSPAWYAWFGARGLGELAARGSIVPTLFTLPIAALFAVFGAYALSAAGFIRRLPLLKTVLVLLALIYTLRGLVLILDLFALVTVLNYPPRAAVFSGVSLSIGLAYSIGTIRAWPRLRKTPIQPSHEAGI